jgi:drug/metabolite transporter (DMT)-like permease
LAPTSARVGVALAVGGAGCYGVTVVVGRRLAEDGVASSTALGTRFAISATMLAVAIAIRRRPVVLRGRQLLIVLGLGVLYGSESTLFFHALERGTAAGVALVFYAYPALVTVIELARGRERVHRATVIGLALSAAGTAVIVVSGGRVAITGAGALFALGAAATFAVYLLVGREVSRGIEPMTAACWVAVGACVGTVARGAATAELANPSGHWPVLALYGLATASAFTLTFAAMQRIGTTRVAVVMTLEAVSTVLLAAAFLHETIGLRQALGGVAVLGAAVVIARSADEPAPVDTLAPAGMDGSREPAR